MIVAGGTYIEECVAPPISSLLGSGGRAALALRDLAPVSLHTFHPDDADIQANFGPAATVYRSSTRLRFRYLHPLARPDVDWHPQTRVAPVRVAGDKVLRFGCLEGEFVVDAGEAVYDPQGDGTTFRANGSSAGRLAVVLNELEARDITGLADPTEAARMIMASDKADAVVVKRGPLGALVMEQGQGGPAFVSAFRTGTLHKVGSGDVFSAMFSHYWLTCRMTAVVAAELASRQVADYVTTRVLPRPAMPPPMEAAGSRIGTPRVLVAADTDTTAGLWLESEAVEALVDLGVSCATLPPDAAAGQGMAERLRDHDVVLALPRTTAGTAMLTAEASCANGRPCVAFAETLDVSAALARTGALVVSDFAASIYSAVWEAS